MSIFDIFREKEETVCESSERQQTTHVSLDCVGLISRILRCILHIQITTHYKIFFRLTHLQTLTGQDVCCLTRSLGKRGLHADTIWTGQRKNWQASYYTRTSVHWKCRRRRVKRQPLTAVAVYLSWHLIKKT